MGTKKFQHLPYRLGVGLMLLNRDNYIFIGQRKDTRSETWQMPQGGIDDGEPPHEAALRELEEEIGTRNVSIIAESQEWFSYDIPAYLIPKLWGGKYRGQQQKWFALRFLGEDNEINIETEHPEFRAWQWIHVNELMQHIVPFKRELYLAVIREFRSILYKDLPPME